MQDNFILPEVGPIELNLREDRDFYPWDFVLTTDFRLLTTGPSH
jgi:hypothetical protein